VSAADFPVFTEKEKAYLRSTLPTEEEVMLGWALPVLGRPPVECRVLVAAQIEVLEGFDPDPAGWCARALELAAREGERRAH
jgi:hypothetical protein